MVIKTKKSKYKRNWDPPKDWLWKVNKPVKYFMGDKDKDGIMDMFDCAPNNPRKQGPQHLPYGDYGFKMSYNHPKEKVQTAEDLLDELEEDKKKKDKR